MKLSSAFLGQASPHDNAALPKLITGSPRTFAYTISFSNCFSGSMYCGRVAICSRIGFVSPFPSASVRSWPLRPMRVFKKRALNLRPNSQSCCLGGRLGVACPVSRLLPTYQGNKIDRLESVGNQARFEQLAYEASCVQSPEGVTDQRDFGYRRVLFQVFFYPLVVSVP